MGLQLSITAIGSMVMQSANNGLGTTYVSGFAAGAKIKQLMMCPFDAFGIATSTFLSQNYGARKAKRIKEGFGVGLKIGIVYGVMAGVILFFFGRTLSALFISLEEVEALDASYDYLRRLGYFYPMLGMLMVSRMALQGLGYSNRAMLAGIIEMILRSVFASIFVPIYKFDAITFTDQLAWFGGVVYLLPMFIFTFKQVEKNIEYELRYMQND